jgi:hypothetical protein
VNRLHAQLNQLRAHRDAAVQERQHLVRVLRTPQPPPPATLPPTYRPPPARPTDKPGCLLGQC